MLVYLLMRVIDILIEAYIIVLIVRMMLDWVAVLFPRWYPRGIIASIIDLVYRVTEPPLRWLRRYIPPIRMGAIAFDMSFVVLYFLLAVLRILL